ncbi:MAG: hypothetical protein HOP02_11175, partial [Methylococcaceae bacterium]|nr:hypothetical protein [Methylococcaceae bacterium]
GYPHAFIASPGRPMIDLGTLGGDYSEGHGINASGQVVGLFAGGGFVTDNGIMKDLNTLLPSGSGWKILIARAINDAGQITGKGSHNGKQRAFLLTPSSGSSNPDPKTCLMNWAEATYPSLFAPAGAATQIAAPYTYRYYLKSDAYLGVSAADNHVYYLGADRVLLDAGDLASWLTKAKCQ